MGYTFFLFRGGRDLVRPERFELPTCCSGGNRSIQLSYGRVSPVYIAHGGPAILARPTCERELPAVSAASTTTAATATATSTTAAAVTTATAAVTATVSAAA